MTSTGSAESMAIADVTTQFRLDGRTAIVTGASSGLGHRFTRVLAAAGANVVAAARRLDRLEDLASGDKRIVPLRCDVTVAGDREALFQCAMDRFGRVDVLVNNAGTSAEGPAETEPIEQFVHVLDVNLTSGYALTQLTARHMLERGSGSIINVASNTGLGAAFPLKAANYCASKGAVVNLTRELGTQWARRGLRVNCIAPGWFETEMTEGMFDEGSSSLRFIQRNTPMGRQGRVGELDGALLFLASDASSFCTGQILVIDGGWSAW